MTADNAPPWWIDRFELQEPVGTGIDGVAYRAIDRRTGGPVELRLLHPASERERAALARRLKLLDLVNHPAARCVLEAVLDGPEPALVLEPSDARPLADHLAARLPLPLMDVLTWAKAVTEALAAAHRVGLAHGRLTPRTIGVTSAGGLWLDFTGVDTSSVADRVPGLPSLAGASAAGFNTTASADLAELGGVLDWLLHTGRAGDPAVTEADVPTRLAVDDGGPVAQLELLIRDLRAADPTDRPSAAEAVVRLTRIVQPLFAPTLEDPGPTNVGLGGPVPATFAPGEVLGRFRLVARLGHGGMGTVFRAEDVADGAVVAVKVLNADLAQKEAGVRRFRKEARLLAEVNNPFVVRLLEVNEHAGVPYLAMELVEGRSLREWIAEKGKLDEPTALAVAADIARALADAHERGIIHRDVKPENVLGQFPAEGPPRVKLSDFGLARHVEQSESLAMTQGSPVGTPLYMAPEQGLRGGPVDSRSDVYALGATLYHMLAGRPPYLADTPVAILRMHAGDPLPPLRTYNPAVSEGVCQIVERAMAKAPEDRFPDGGEFLRAVERLHRGEPTKLAVHPRLPNADPSRVLTYEFKWALESPPRKLWPHVSNTERLNRAIGLPAVAFTTEAKKGGGSRRAASARKLGIVAAWEEHPFEWVEGKRLGVLREFTRGPFRWLASTVELEPTPAGGTTLTHRIRVEPSGTLGRVVAAVEVGRNTRRNLERVYTRIDAALAGKLGSPTADPFEATPALSKAQRQQLEALLDQLIEEGVDAGLAERLGEFLEEAPPQEVARIRPLAVAERLALDPNQFVAACLHGAREGLLVLLWDILCPVCRVASEVRDTLKELAGHGHCEACNLDYDLDFANSVEMIFRPHPSVRPVETGTYCIGGPAHSPHVAAQVRVAPGERVELGVALPEGAYRLRGPQLPYAIDFRVTPAGRSWRWEMALGGAERPEPPGPLRADGQVLIITNAWSEELIVRVERTAPRTDALTAARAAALALFRELFPDEVLSSGQLISVATVTLLATDLDGAGKLYRDLGDAKAFTRVHEHFRRLEDCVRRESGAVVKTSQSGLMAAFTDPAAAVRVALDLPADLAKAEATRELSLRSAVHRGPALTATVNDQLDYFGATVNLAVDLPRHARGGQVVLSAAVAADPQVARLLAARGLRSEARTVTGPADESVVAHVVDATKPRPAHGTAKPASG